MDYADIVNKMTLEEKASLLSGKDFWHTQDISRLGIPSLVLADGPHGVRLQKGRADHLGMNVSEPATCFPTAAAMANGWDEALAEAVGEMLGEEAASQGVHVLLGPGLNIKRSPLCGRNFEYYSEDPYLSGKMAAACIRGIQKMGVSACPKHFAVNSQELRRMSVDAVVDERTLREIYLTGFEIAVKEGRPAAVMTAYNKINGIYANENEHLLQDILYGEWKHEGIVVTDWGGSNDHVKGTAAGSHLEMPAAGVDGTMQIMAAVRSGELPEGLLDQRVDELLGFILSADRGLRDRKEKDFDIETHHRLAARAAAACIVLLKNEGGLLPLRKSTKVAVIGDFARQVRCQGAGSSMVNPTKLSHPRELLGKSVFSCVGFAKGFQRNGKADQALLAEAVELAQRAEAVFFYMGLNEQAEAEGRDRESMELSGNQAEVLKAVASVNPNVVVILSAGAPVEMAWSGYARAIVHGYLSGQAGAEAMIEVLDGTTCPSGKLAETHPLQYKDTPAYHYYPGREKTCEYREAVYVGYRYYDTAQVPVKYAFGYGLSYTTFEYSHMQVSKEKVTLTIANTGAWDGAEIVQLYIGKKDSCVYRPGKELKGFAKIFLKAGEEKQIEILLDDKSFRYYDAKQKRWRVEGGSYELMAAASVNDIRLTAKLTVDGDEAEPASGCGASDLPSYWTADIRHVPDDEFEKLLGFEIPEGSFKKGEALDINSPLCQMKYAKSRLARLIFHVLDGLKKRNEKAAVPSLNILFIYNVPFRGIAKMTGGMVSMKMAQSMCDMANGHILGGFGRLVRAFIGNERARRGRKGVN